MNKVMGFQLILLVFEIATHDREQQIKSNEIIKINFVLVVQDVDILQQIVNGVKFLKNVMVSIQHFFI